MVRPDLLSRAHVTGSTHRFVFFFNFYQHCFSMHTFCYIMVIDDRGLSTLPDYASVYFKKKMLLSLGSYYLLYNRPINQKISCWGKELWLFWKSSIQRRWWTNVLKNHLPWVRIWASFIPKVEEVKVWFSQTPERILISSFLQRLAWSGCFQWAKQMYF